MASAITPKENPLRFRKSDTRRNEALFSSFKKGHFFWIKSRAI
jgi:hypothetical protein